MSYRVQRFQTTVTIPSGADTADSPTVDANNNSLSINGILKGISINAPALTGTAFTIWILGQRGETLFTQAGELESGVRHINKDADDFPLDVPLSLYGVSAVRIKSTGTPDATGTLTFNNTGPITDGQTVTIGARVYRFKDTLVTANDVKIVADVKAQGTVTSDATNPDDGGTITIGAVTYTFRTALSSGPTVANEILIDSDAATTLDNLKLAINAGAGIGTKYSTGTVVHPTVTATTNTDTTQIIEAITAGTSGNAIVFTENATHLTVNGSGTLGTTQAGAWSGDSTLDNLKKAINHEATEGTNYGTGTTADPLVTSGSVTAHAIILTAVEGVEDGTDVATTDTATNLSFGAVTLTGGGEATSRVFDVDLLIDRG